MQKFHSGIRVSGLTMAVSTFLRVAKLPLNKTGFGPVTLNLEIVGHKIDSFTLHLFPGYQKCRFNKKNKSNPNVSIPDVCADF